MANVRSGVFAQYWQYGQLAPFPGLLWKTTVTVPAGETSISIEPEDEIAGVITEVWIDPGTLAANATIKGYMQDDGLTTPRYFVNYTAPNPAVESRSLAVAQGQRVHGLLQVDVASAVAGNTFDLYVFAEPSAVGVVGFDQTTQGTTNKVVVGAPATPWCVGADYAAAQTNASLKAAPAAGTALYITDIMVTNDATAAITFKLLDGSGGTNVTGTHKVAASGGFVLNLTTPIKLTAATALCVTTTGTSNSSVFVAGYTA